MRRRICLLFALVSAAAAQTQFEVASIRPSGTQSVRGSDGGPGHRDPTRFTYGRAELLSLILMAYNVNPFQVSSHAPLDREAFDLAANVPAGATKEQFRVMLQNLLKDRFNLKVHLESKEFPAYELVVLKSGLKLKEAVAGESASRPDGPPSRPAGDIGWPEFPPNVAHIVAQNSGIDGYGLTRVKAQFEPISLLATFLRPEDNLPVVDKTGLTGVYSFTLEYTTDRPGAMPDTPPPAPSIFTAVQQQLGLQLVSKKLPFDVVVVESFNKLPTDN